MVRAHSCLQEPSACETVLDHTQFLCNKKKDFLKVLFLIGSFLVVLRAANELQSSVCATEKISSHRHNTYGKLTPSRTFFQLKSKKHYRIVSFQGFTEGPDMIKSQTNPKYLLKCTYQLLVFSAYGSRTNIPTLFFLFSFPLQPMFCSVWF